MVTLSLKTDGQEGLPVASQWGEALEWERGKSKAFALGKGVQGLVKSSLT